MTGKRKRKLAMPDTLIIVASVVLLVAILSWIIPSGTYDYQEMNINGRIRNVAIDGTYHTIDKSEVTHNRIPWIFQCTVSRLRGGCWCNLHDPLLLRNFGVVVKTGAFHAGIGTILKKLKGKENSALFRSLWWSSDWAVLCLVWQVNSTDFIHWS